MMGAPTRHRGRSRYPTRSRNAGATGAAPATFNPLTDWTTDPVHGFWASDPLWVPPADGGAVSSWRNGGSVGGDLVQATGSKQPTYRASTAAYNNKPTVQFATDDVLAVDIANLAQPFYIVVVGNATSGGTSDVLVGFGGGSSNAVYEFGSGSQWGAAIGAGYILGGTSNSNPHLIRNTVNGASSEILVDETSVATGTIGAGSLEVLSIGAGNNGVGTYLYHLTGHIAYAAVFTTNPAGQAEWATFKAWVTSTYGITVA